SLFARTGGLPGAMDSRAQILARDRTDRQRLRRPEPILHLPADGGNRRLAEHRLFSLWGQQTCSLLKIRREQRDAIPLAAQAASLCSAVDYVCSDASSGVAATWPGTSRKAVP